MRNQINYYVRLIKGGLIIGKIKYLVSSYVRLHYQNFTTAGVLQYAAYHIFRRRFTQIVYVRLERQSHHRYHRTAPILYLKIGYRTHHLFRTPERFVIVHLTRLSNQTRLHRKIRRDKVRVYRNTVPPYPATGFQYIHPRMLVGQTDQLPDVDPSLVTYK